MVVDLQRRAFETLGALRMQPTAFRIRGYDGPTAVVDSRRAVLVWEPGRVTPSYAVPRADVRVPLQEQGPPRRLTAAERQRRVLDPSVPFDAHTAPGTRLTLAAPSGGVDAFAFADDDLAGVVAIDFAALRWWEEEAEAFAHPRDPEQRIDVRPSGARLVLASEGVVLVDTTRAVVLAETRLPPRWYVPADDVRVPLEPSGTVTWCAYKGRATYRSALLDGRRLDDIAWCYEQPLADARDVGGRFAFFAERLDTTLDGVAVPRRGMPG